MLIWDLSVAWTGGGGVTIPEPYATFVQGRRFFALLQFNPYSTFCPPTAAGWSECRCQIYLFLQKDALCITRQKVMGQRCAPGQPLHKRKRAIGNPWGWGGRWLAAVQVALPRRGHFTLSPYPALAGRGHRGEAGVTNMEAQCMPLPRSFSCFACERFERPSQTVL